MLGAFRMKTGKNFPNKMVKMMEDCFEEYRRKIRQCKFALHFLQCIKVRKKMKYSASKNVQKKLMDKNRSRRKGCVHSLSICFSLVQQRDANETTKKHRYIRILRWGEIKESGTSVQAKNTNTNRLKKKRNLRLHAIKLVDEAKVFFFLLFTCRCNIGISLLKTSDFFTISRKKFRSGFFSSVPEKIERKIFSFFCQYAFELL